MVQRIAGLLGALGRFATVAPPPIWSPGSRRRPATSTADQVLGLDNAGKTTILKKLSDEEISHIMPTQGAAGRRAAAKPAPAPPPARTRSSTGTPYQSRNPPAAYLTGTACTRLQALTSSR
eukprot:SAG22_NODE_1567_length_4104_cov_2.041698_3_plen_121_part_00